MLRNIDFASGQFAFESELGVGREMFSVTSQLQKLIVTLRFVRLDEFLNLHRPGC
jgi:hypothetical protein